MNPRKEIHETSIQGYFVTAAMEILRSEGVKALSVRNVAERAGYSYATLYNYFQDLPSLLRVCVAGFLDECAQFVAERVQSQPPAARTPRQVARAYALFFVQYPGIFELLFLERLGDIGNQSTTAQAICGQLEKLVAMYGTPEGQAPAQPSPLQLQNLYFSLTGLLLSYLNRRHPEDFATFSQALDQAIAMAFA